MEKFEHTPVLLQEVLEGLNISPQGLYADLTLGGGGHTRAILERSAPDGRVVGVDQDEEALEHCRGALSDFQNRLMLVAGNFGDLKTLLADFGENSFDGMLADLGVSSHQLTQGRRGFSLANDGPLDMRMDPTRNPMRAIDFIHEKTEEEIARVLKTYGEEPFAGPIARALKQSHRSGMLTSTRVLADIVSRVIPKKLSRKKEIHPATRTFMALRIAVNDELGVLQKLLENFLYFLKPGGRIGIIAFHSLEDRMVKNALRQMANPCNCPPGLPVCVCGKKPLVTLPHSGSIKPTIEESIHNPRARSSRLRIAQKV